MMQLLKFELYKIFRQKIIYITFLGLIILSSSYILNFDRPDDSTKELYKRWEGAITEEKLEEAQTENEKLMVIFEQRLKEMEKNGEHGQAFTEYERVKSGLFESIAYIQNAKNNLNQRLIELESENNYNTELEKQLINNVDLSYFSYNKAPKEIIDYAGTIAFILTGAMLLIGLSSIYTRDFNTGVDHYILSSKKGRKTLTWAKIGASLIYAFVVVLAWEIVNVISKIVILGNFGWGTPIQHVFKYYFSPYGFNMLEFHLIQMGIHLAAAFAFALLIIWISSISKNSLLSFFISGAIFAIPFLVVEMMMLQQWLEDVFKFSFIYIMRVEFLFAHFRTVNFFGFPILYPVVAVLWMIILSTLLIFFTLKVMKNKEVTA